ncbi:MAG: hypothetical protein A2Z95_07845 [Gallionellales bacterium GWA2_60_18]|nr:MAG: hypothetical protein A2Z95_07845 [Gallionellales bacterium GWA2_60_18]
MAAVMQRRGELLARIAAQRGQVADTAARWQAPLAIADRGVAAIRFLRERPLLVAGVATLFVIRRRGMLGLVRLGWMAWKGYRYLGSLKQRFAGIK